MQRHTSFLIALAVVGVSATIAMAQPQQPHSAPNAPVAGGNAAAVLPGGRTTTTATTGVQTQTTVTGVQSGLIQGGIGIGIGQRFNCAHVIDMLVRKAHLAQFGGRIHAPAVHSIGPFGEHVIVRPQLADLVLKSVGMIADATPDCAPVYAVTICNNGNFDVGCFHVSAAAVLGEIHEFSPVTTIKVPKLCAGESVTVELKLPFAAMAMGNANHRCPFDTLVVAIDAFDVLPECDECNNLLVLKRAEITIVQTQIGTTVQQTTTEEIVPPSVNGNAAAPTAPAPDGNNASPLDNIDLDNLDLSDADGAAFRVGS